MSFGSDEPQKTSKMCMTAPLTRFHRIEQQCERYF